MKKLKQIIKHGLVGLLSLSSITTLLTPITVHGEEKITIEYWHQSSDTQGGQAVRDLIKKFNESQDEIEVVDVFNADGYPGLMTNLQAAATSGNTPALAQIGWSHREYFVNNFNFVEPEQIINDYFPEDKDYIDAKFDENIWALGTSLDDKTAGIPYSVSVPVLYANNDILKEAGVDASELTSWEKVKEAAKTVADNTDKEGIFVEPTAWIAQTMLEMNNVKLIEDGTSNFATDDGFYAYQLVQDMINEGSALNVTASEGYSAYLAGDVALATLSIAKQSDVSNNAQFEAIGIPFPSFEGKEQAAPAGGNFLAITAEEEEQQKAVWTFIKFLLEPENINIWVKGTGYFPPTIDAKDDEELNKLMNKDPIFAGATANYDNIVEWVSFPGDAGVDAEREIVSMVEAIASRADTKETMTSAQEEINKLLD